MNENGQQRTWDLEEMAGRYQRLLELARRVGECQDREDQARNLLRQRTQERKMAQAEQSTFLRAQSRPLPLFDRLMPRPAPIEGKQTSLIPEDVPEPGETVHAYRLVSNDGAFHVSRTVRGRRRGGSFVRATYEYIPDQPDEATLRNNALWQAWARQQAGKEQL